MYNECTMEPVAEKRPNVNEELRILMEQSLKGIDMAERIQDFVCGGVFGKEDKPQTAMGVAGKLAAISYNLAQLDKALADVMDALGVVAK